MRWIICPKPLLCDFNVAVEHFSLSLHITVMQRILSPHPSKTQTVPWKDYQRVGDTEQRNSPESARCPSRRITYVHSFMKYPSVCPRAINYTHCNPAVAAEPPVTVQRTRRILFSSQCTMTVATFRAGQSLKLAAVVGGLRS